MGLRYLTGIVTPNASGSQPDADKEPRSWAAIQFREPFDKTCISGDVRHAEPKAFGATGKFAENPKVLLGIEAIDAAVAGGRCQAEVEVVSQELTPEYVKVSWKGVARFHFLILGETKESPSPAPTTP